MTTDECNERATRCAANASLAKSPSVALEFMRLAAQWRSMATPTIPLDLNQLSSQAPEGAVAGGSA